MKNKATHTGHCQVCGAEQKLPNGQLSTHGYTVEFNFFNGICRGTKHLPFEQDISLIEGAIQSALEIKARYESLIAQYTNSTESSAWFHNYKTDLLDFRGRRRSGYVWEYLPVFFDTKHYPADGTQEFWSHKYGCTEEEAKSFRSRHDAGITYTPEFPMANVVETLNNYYRFQVLYPELEKITHYIQWQRDRIRDWKPSELKPIPEVEPLTDEQRSRVARRRSRYA